MMREILEDAHQHMDDGIGRAQAHAKKQMRQRFYKNVGIGTGEAGFTLTLDDRPTKTPGGAVVVVPSRALAALMAEEWGAQETHIDPETMPVVRLVNSAIEGGEGALEALTEEVMRFVNNDLLLFRADSPKELVAVQEQHWDAALAEISRHFSVKFRPVVGVIHKDQPEATLTELKSALAGLNYFAATALVSITGLTGSGLLALALRHDLLKADAAWAAGHVDEDYNAKLWGADTLALSRLQNRRLEFDAALRVLELTDKD